MHVMVDIQGRGWVVQRELVRGGGPRGQQPGPGQIYIPVRSSSRRGEEILMDRGIGKCPRGRGHARLHAKGDKLRRGMLMGYTCSTVLL